LPEATLPTAFANVLQSSHSLDLEVKKESGAPGLALQFPLLMTMKLHSHSQRADARRVTHHRPKQPIAICFYRLSIARTKPLLPPFDIHSLLPPNYGHGFKHSPCAGLSRNKPTNPLPAKSLLGRFPKGNAQIQISVRWLFLKSVFAEGVSMMLG
jgi:hypothetical protein